ncbi:PIN domain-containing protein [bacterium CPR1]|nr:PIN domain-containing protein [bacterium CPR1]
MGKGLDTSFLLQVEVLEHPAHRQAVQLRDRFVEKDERLALAPQILSEFIHVSTDPKRFQAPLEPHVAVDRAQWWWNLREVIQVFPTDESTSLFFHWMKEHRLGRKRLLDTQLAATYRAAGVDTIVTDNVRDFTVFGCFKIITVTC